MTDPYSVLGIQPGADEETIKKAYRQKCKQYHPDLHPNDPTAEDKFKEVQAPFTRSGSAALKPAATPAVNAPRCRRPTTISATAIIPKRSMC